MTYVLHVTDEPPEIKRGDVFMGSYKGIKNTMVAWRSDWPKHPDGRVLVHAFGSGMTDDYRQEIRDGELGFPAALIIRGTKDDPLLSTLEDGTPAFEQYMDDAGSVCYRSKFP